MPLDGDDNVTWFPPDTLLKDELPGMSTRIAVSFAFMSQGELIELDEEIVSHNRFDHIELLAAVGNGLDREGMFSQAVCSSNVNHLSPSEWGPNRASWCTSKALYYLTVPHPDYHDTWMRTLKSVWPKENVDVKPWPLEGCRPTWWSAEYKHDWPFDPRQDKGFGGLSRGAS
ncbi:hypothetical protein RhiXN_03613 [Rhizoctonia solani]|uniref:Uncharacterized protein n=1 Tax=Rhizoctonia solani TaxID=456999 RepID=A0A8H8SSV6_9AGAM|nr:uncharacterized protein RhiXN_03613 [Rhizoctonia solani]QRW15612.1 hypothetical protein RhiXN_03613 [Rhizoctonia solani]